METGFTIGGRSWRAVKQTTFEHDIALSTIVRRSGITMPDASVTAEEFEARAFFRLMETGEIFNLLGAVAIPAKLADLDWTEKIGAESAQFFRTINDQQEKEKLQAVLVTLVLNFFAPVLVSLRRLQSVSSQVAPGVNGKAMRAPNS